MIVEKNDNETQIDFGVGIFCFNPKDDPYHLERIQMTIKSTIKDAIRSKSTVKIVLCLNKGLLKQFSPPICGIGPKTDEFIKQISDVHGLEIIEYTGPNANAPGYRKVMKHLYENSNSSKITVFADDYIVPTGWFDRMQTNFTNHSEYDFIMPSTSFVWQKKLNKRSKIP